MKKLTILIFLAGLAKAGVFMTPNSMYRDGDGIAVLLTPVKVTTYKNKKGVLQSVVINDKYECTNKTSKCFASFSITTKAFKSCVLDIDLDTCNKVKGQK